MQAVRGGDVAKLGLLFERHHGAVFHFFCRMTGNRTVAEDLTQEVFVRMLKHRLTYRDDGSFETWMFGIARNAGVDHFRKRKPVYQLGDETADRAADAPGPARQAEQNQETSLLMEALLRLREDRRELIVLTRYREMKHEQIAELLGVDTGTIKVRIHRAIKELRDIYLGLTEKQRCDVKTRPRTLRII
jgi:RNA polymerase sigma-70 factor (ECF subfamily)